MDVWWDRKIPPGKTFDDVITEQLENTHCVVVLWSKHSVISRWVKEEAAEAESRKIFVPVMIDNVKIPMGFRRIEAAQLINWKANLNHPEFQQLISSVNGLLNLPQPTFDSQLATPKIFNKINLLNITLMIVALVSIILLMQHFLSSKQETDTSFVSTPIPKNSSFSEPKNKASYPVPEKGDFEQVPRLLNDMPGYIPVTTNDIKTRNTATYLGETQGKKKWEWTIFLEASPRKLNQLKCVEYVLHPTFSNPFQKICNSSNGFPFTATGWGTFKVKVHVTTKDGRQIALPDHQLHF